MNITNAGWQHGDTFFQNCFFYEFLVNVCFTW